MQQTRQGSVSFLLVSSLALRPWQVLILAQVFGSLMVSDKFCHLYFYRPQDLTGSQAAASFLMTPNPNPEHVAHTIGWFLNRVAGKRSQQKEEGLDWSVIDIHYL